MGDPRGLIQRDVLGRKRKLRARLSFPADYELRTGQRFGEFMVELERLEEDPFDYDADHLIAALAELCEGGGDSLTDEDIEQATFGDFPHLIEAINDAVVATGLMKLVEEVEAEAAKKKMKVPSSSRGKTGKK